MQTNDDVSNSTHDARLKQHWPGTWPTHMHNITRSSPKCSSASSHSFFSISCTAMPNWHTSHHKPPRTRSCNQAALIFCESVSNTTNMETFSQQGCYNTPVPQSILGWTFLQTPNDDLDHAKICESQCFPVSPPSSMEKTCKKGNGNCAIISLSKLEFPTSPVASESRNGAWFFFEIRALNFPQNVLPGESAGVGKK